MAPSISLLLAAGAAAVAAAQGIPKHWGQPRFAGQSIMVTSGDSGIGLAAVEAFYYECGSVMMVGHDVAKTKEAYVNLTALPPPTGCSVPARLAWVAVDVSNATQVAQAVNATVAAFGGLDVAVNNAGAGGSGDYQIADSGFLEYFEHSVEMKVNVQGTLNCMHEELRYWNASKWKGVMVNVASIAGEMGWANPTYTTSKWAMIGFSKNAAVKYAGTGIRVNVLAPGLINTPMLRDGLSPDDPKWLKRKAQYEAIVPTGRIAEPWEMAGPITFLASDMSSYLSGHVLTADGGLTGVNPFTLHAPEPSMDSAAQEFSI